MTQSDEKSEISWKDLSNACTINPINKDSTYRTTYMLDSDQVQAGIIAALADHTGQTMAEVQHDYYIRSSGIGGSSGIEATPTNITDLEDFYALKSAFLHTQTSGKPSFFGLTESDHTVCIALVPHPETKKGKHPVSVVYMNSITGINHRMAEVGRKMADSFQNAINTMQNEKMTVIDASRMQQYHTCCGLSAIINAAAVAEHCKNNKPITQEALRNSLWCTNADMDQRKSYYQELGKKLWACYQDILQAGKNYGNLKPKILPSDRARAEQKTISTPQQEVSKPHTKVSAPPPKTPKPAPEKSALTSRLTQLWQAMRATAASIYGFLLGSPPANKIYSQTSDRMEPSASKKSKAPKLPHKEKRLVHSIEKPSIHTIKRKMQKPRFR
jgi:hypothetical protein